MKELLNILKYILKQDIDLKWKIEKIDFQKN